MEVQLSEVRTVTVSGIQSKWSIPPKEQCVVGDNTFVKLVMTNWGLFQVVNCGNELAPAAETTDSKFANKTLANCIGLHKLLELRNEEQAKQLSSGAGVGSTLFGEDKQSPNKIHRKDQHVPKFELAKLRAQQNAITIAVPIGNSLHSIQVLRPVQARDAIWIIYEQVALQVVIQFLRISGFNEPQPKKIKHQGDGMVQKVGDRFRVVIMHDGKKKFKLVDSLEEAMKDHHIEEHDDHDADMQNEQNAGDQNVDEPDDDRDEHSVAKPEAAIDEHVSAEPKAEISEID
jgi:hypothetical protein